MANLAPVASLVIPGADAKFISGRSLAGEAVVAGDVVYKKASDGKYYKADCNTATTPATGQTFPPEAIVVGIVVTQVAAANQPIDIQYDGLLTIGDTVVQAGVYVLSATAGKIAPIADLVAAQTPPQNLVILGIASTVAILDVGIIITNIAK